MTASGSSMSTASSSTRLLDLQDELLSECMPRDGRSMAWAATCRRLMQLALRGPSSRTIHCLQALGLSLELRQHGDVEQRRMSLQRLSRAFPELSKLCLGIHLSPVQDQLDQLLLQPPGEDPAWLRNITSVTLKATYLQGILPLSLAIACPGLRTLSIKDAMLCNPQHRVTSHTGLQSLIIQNSTLEMSAATFEQQLQGLCNVHNLVMDMSRSGPPLSPGHAAAISKSMSARLSAFFWYTHPLQQASLSALLPRPFPLLVKLSMMTTTVDDAAMDLIQKHLPALSDLQVLKVQLDSDFSNRPSRLETMTLGPVVDVASLARMPLHSVWDLTVLHTCALEECHIHLPDSGKGLTEDLRLTTTAVTALQRTGGIRFDDPETDCNVYLPKSKRRGVRVLDAAIPLFDRARTITLHNAFVSMELCRVVAKLPAKKLQFAHGCELERSGDYVVRVLLDRMQGMNV